MLMVQGSVSPSSLSDRLSAACVGPGQYRPLRPLSRAEELTSTDAGGGEAAAFYQGFLFIWTEVTVIMTLPELHSLSGGYNERIVQCL